MRILVASGTWYPARNGVARVAAGLALDAPGVARDAEVDHRQVRAVVVAVAGAELEAVAGALVTGTVVVAGSGDPPRTP